MLIILLYLDAIYGEEVGTTVFTMLLIGVCKKQKKAQNIFMKSLVKLIENINWQKEH